MLPKKNRVPRAVLKRLSRATQNTFHTPHLYLKVENHESSSSPRYSVIVSKKVVQTAVERNKLRRRIYSALRDEKFDHQKGIYTIIVKKGAKRILYRELAAEVSALLRETHSRS